MSTDHQLTDHFLLAMPGLTDPNFNQTLTYICSHDRFGAMGLVLNRPLDLDVAELLAQLDISCPLDLLKPVLSGGPVQPERGFILHEPGPGDWQSTLAISESMALTVSQDILTAIALGNGPQNYQLALGYAGWGEGQLEAELAANAWLTIPADRQTIFETPFEQMAKVAARKLGFDLSTLSGEAGHA